MPEKGRGRTLQVMNSSHAASAVVLDPLHGLDALVRTLTARGYAVVGPVERDGVVDYRPIESGDEMPTGLRVEQAPGRWRSHHEGDTRFGWTPAAESWRRPFFPAEEEVLRVRRTDGTFAVSRPEPAHRPVALIAARDCEVRALHILDRVLLGGEHPDPRYAARRADAFVVAVTCSVPAATCWCTSMGGGPRPAAGFDIRLTELIDPHHAVLAEAGSDRGAEVLAALGGALPSSEHLAASDSVEAAAVASMRRPVDGLHLPVALAGRDLDPHWDDVAARCLSCGNCTFVCPTCACVAFGDSTALTDDGGPAVETVRHQTWASCFQLDHSNLGGRPVRATVASRYRQWLTHKLQTWPEQFGTSGCVGCGRCTTWCPAGIDLPIEAAALAAAGEGTVS